MDSKNKIKVLIVDDSALIRQTLNTIISANKDMEVIASAADPYVAVNKMKSEKPDVITLDIQMPRMDGLTFLKKIMLQHPVPVVIISSLTQKESDLALSAYKLGAIAVLEKPVMSSELLHKDWIEKLEEAILTAANSNLTRLKLRKQNTFIKKEHTAPSSNKPNKVCNNFILIGSSAGGTEVISEILSMLDTDMPPILIVQHMPVEFTASYAQRLNDNSKLNVREAVSGDELSRGIALIAPGDKHMELNNNGFNFFVKLNSEQKVNRHRPSVDVLFASALKYTSINILAIILSGMGNDGSSGMLRLKETGAITVVQNRETSIVYGMPKEALKIGAADYSLSTSDIVKAINKFSKRP
ncbi:MAG: chemotaxis response regulator protein-glutamate methylesterase [Bacteroidota bacterium]